MIPLPMNFELVSESESSQTLALTGRLDGHGTGLIEPALRQLAEKGPPTLTLDFAGVNYISSAGLRLLVMVSKILEKRGGSLSLTNLNPYVSDVIEMAGFKDLWSGSPDQPSPGHSSFEDLHTDWSNALHHQTEQASLRILPWQQGESVVAVAGDIMDVLAARVNRGLVQSKHFSETEYSIGLGALGATAEECLPLMGEMITIGGTMVWLPTDGNDTPDYLIPKNDTGKVTLRTGFNASLPGPFHDLVDLRSLHHKGLTISEVYRTLFDFARIHRPTFRGCLGLAMVAQMPTLLGAGVLKAPISDQAPANGLLITDPSNFSDWFEFDKTPRHRNITGLIAGCGLDLAMDLSHFNQTSLKATFYVNPANRGSSQEMLHNHAVIFDRRPLAETLEDLESEIARVIQHGTFRDMRHLLDSSTVSRALIGVQYITDFRPDDSWEK
jgi:anti-anti-sigma factor